MHGTTYQPISPSLHKMKSGEIVAKYRKPPLKIVIINLWMIFVTQQQQLVPSTDSSDRGPRSTAGCCHRSSSAWAASLWVEGSVFRIWRKWWNILSFILTWTLQPFQRLWEDRRPVTLFRVGQQVAELNEFPPLVVLGPASPSHLRGYIWMRN